MIPAGTIMTTIKNKSDIVIQTYSEVVFYPFAPTSEMVNIADIAHACALNCRFNGHLKTHYSVAQHCVLTAQLIWEQTRDPILALWGLLHDGSEAYIADLASPIKKGIPGYKETEKAIQAAIIAKYKLPEEEPPIVKEVDLRLLVTEARDLMPRSWLLRHGWKYNAEPYTQFTIDGWIWEKAEQEYLKTFEWLMLERVTGQAA